MIDLYKVVAAILTVVFLVHFVPWILDLRGIRGYPGPFIAKFSDIWLGYVSKMGHRSEVIHEIHQQFGTRPFIVPHKCSA